MRLGMFSSGGPTRLGLVMGPASDSTDGAGIVPVEALPDSDVGLRPLVRARSVREFLALGPDVLARAEESVARLVVTYDGQPVEGSMPLAEVVLHNPLPDLSKFIGVGLNYREHIEEQSARAPKNPILFGKYQTSLVGPTDDVRHPASTEELDYEVELGVVIGDVVRDADAERGAAAIAGYVVVNDVTARDVQRSDRQWHRSKSLDATTPVGPFVVTAAEVPDPARLRLRLWLNDTLMQDGTTADLITPIPELISFVSKDVTLLPGDLIATGTPSGVGFTREPPIFLRPGDVMVSQIDGIGTLRNTITRG